jgi:hypothetical protein
MIHIAFSKNHLLLIDQIREKDVVTKMVSPYEEYAKFGVFDISKAWLCLYRKG